MALEKGVAAGRGDARIIRGNERPREVELVARNARLGAERARYAFLSIGGSAAGAYLEFVWQDRDGRRRAVPLIWTPLGYASVDLADNPHWAGELSAPGVSVYGTVPETLTLQSLTLAEDSWRARARHVLASLTAFYGWSQRSAHFAPMRELAPGVSVVEIAALGFGGGAVGYLVVALFRGRRPKGRTIMFLALGFWLVLDAFWLAERGQQLQRTLALFGGKPAVEKRHAADDAWLYQLALRVEEAVADSRGRILVSSFDTTPLDDYRRTRMAYLLRPANVADRPRVPWRRLRADDWVLVIGDGDEDPTHRERDIERVLVYGPAGLYRVKP